MDVIHRCHRPQILHQNVFKFKSLEDAQLRELLVSLNMTGRSSTSSSATFKDDDDDTNQELIAETVARDAEIMNTEFNEGQNATPGTGSPQEVSTRHDESTRMDKMRKWRNSVYN